MIKQLQQVLKKQSKKILILCLFSVVSAIMTLLIPIFVGKIIDEMIAVSFSSFMISIIWLSSFYLIGFVSELILGFVSARTITEILKQTRDKLFDKIHHLPLSYLDKHPYGKILNKFVTDIHNIGNGISSILPRGITGIIIIIGAIIIMIYQNDKMAIFVIGSAPILYFVSRWITKKTQILFSNRADKISELNSYTEEIFMGYKTIQDFAIQEEILQKFYERNEQVYHIGKKAQWYSSLTNPSTRLVSNITYIMIGLIGILFVKNGEISIGMISTFLLYVNVFSRPFQEITSVISEVQIAIASVHEISSFLEQKEEIQKEDTIEIGKKLSGEIEFQNVFFSYDDTPFIQNMNLIVKKGERIAIIGKTGSGKTTMAQLLMKFYPINQGEIFLDGESIHHIPADKVRNNIGIVLQDTKLFYGTIKENISYGTRANEEQIIQAAKLAYADSFIRKLPNGYDTKIEQEDMLSVGETQLITIARMILKNPPILILDEATSNIDVMTEEKIQKAFETMMKGATSFIIAHRLSTIRSADRILVLDHGNIVKEIHHHKD